MRLDTARQSVDIGIDQIWYVSRSSAFLFLFILLAGFCPLSTRPALLLKGVIPIHCISNIICSYSSLLVPIDATTLLVAITPSH